MKKKISHKVSNINQFTKLVDKSITNFNYNKNKFLEIKKIGNKILVHTTKEISNLIKNETQ